MSDDDPILTTMREIDRAQSTPLQDAIDRLGTSGDGLTLEGSHEESGRVSASLEASKSLGRGWSVSGAVQWAKDAGYAAIGKIRWTPGAKK